MTSEDWDSGSYARNGRFVAELAAPLIELLDAQPGEHILDLGCGDGFLAAQIEESGARVVGLDASPSMVAAAKQRGIEVYEGDAAHLEYHQQFDAVVSNAALHWMPDQDAVLDGVQRALRSGGRFVAEMGGHGNIASIRTASLAVLTRYGIPQERIEENCYFTVAEYRSLLDRHRFSVREIHLIPRPTLLPSGIEGWFTTFRRSLLSQLPEGDRSVAIREIADLLRPVLTDANGCWWADYVRLRFSATRA